MSFIRLSPVVVLSYRRHITVLNFPSGLFDLSIIEGNLLRNIWSYNISKESIILYHHPVVNVDVLLVVCSCFFFSLC